MKWWIMWGVVALLYAGEGHAQTPANDLCSGAIVIDCGPFSIQTNTTLATNDYDITGGCTTSGGPDIAYIVDLPAGSTASITLDTLPPNGSGVDGAIYLITDCADPAGTYVACSDVCLAPETIIYTNETGNHQILYLIVDAFTEPGACGAPAGTALLSGSIDCMPTGANHSTWGSVKVRYR